MNKIKTLLLAAVAIALTGCDPHKDYINSEGMPCPDFAPREKENRN